MFVVSWLLRLPLNERNDPLIPGWFICLKSLLYIIPDLGIFAYDRR